MHKADSRVKLALILLLSVSIFSFKPFSLLLVSTYVLLGIFIARIPFMKYRKELTLFFILTVMIVLFRWIGEFTLYQALLAGGRFLVIVLAGLLLTDTTAPEDMTLAIHWILKPIPGIRAAEIATKFSLTISFIPLIFDATQEIREARRSRLENPRRHPLRRLISFGTQVFDLILQKTEEISLALESRLFNPEILHGELRFSRLDLLLILTSSAVAAGIIMLGN